MDGVVITMPGEGIGPEIVSAAERVLDVACQIAGVRIEKIPLNVGLAAGRTREHAFPDEARDICDRFATEPQAAILFGAVTNEPIGTLRKRYDLFANLRPAKTIDSMLHMSSLRPEIARGTDILVVRELTSGIYYGEQTRGELDDGSQWFSAAMYYDDAEMRRITRVALQCAAGRQGKLVLAEKGNVIEDLFARWNQILREEAKDFPNVTVESMYVDNLAMQLVARPATFDVVLAGNMFGDILSDLLASVVGSIGLLSSVSRNETGFALYESVGGTAPDIAGGNVANPASTILCAAMLLEQTFGQSKIAREIENALARTLERVRTKDLHDERTECVGTKEFADAVVQELQVAT